MSNMYALYCMLYHIYHDFYTFVYGLLCYSMLYFGSPILYTTTPTQRGWCVEVVVSKFAVSEIRITSSTFAHLQSQHICNLRYISSTFAISESNSRRWWCIE